MSYGALYISQRDREAGRTNVREADCHVCGFMAAYCGSSIVDGREVYVCRAHESDCKRSEPLRDLPAVGLDWA